MPLRLRLIVLIGLMLLVALASGSVLVGWHAANSVRTELRAALDVGTQTIRNGIDDLAHTDDPGELRHLVGTFNGNRHVRATLFDARQQPVAASRLFIPTQRIPDWFRRLIDGNAATVRIRVPQSGDNGSTIVLETDATNELGEVWTESRDSVLVLAGFAALSVVLICSVVGRALLPLENLSKALDQVGKGHYHARIPGRGPPELTRLANGFNDMTERLATIAAQNRRLNERLLTMQAEERADLARDLHDELGPLLFAVDMTAATIERLADNERATAIPGHVRSIQDAVGRMQRHVRVLLGRLRPIQSIGLEIAIDRLAAFWRSRRPAIAFNVAVSIEEDRIGDDLKETIYRVVQEGLSNAIRHGNPARVEVVVAHDDADGIRVEVADDGIGMAVDGLPFDGMPLDRVTMRDPVGLGLIGMRERVMAMAGAMSIRHGDNSQGLVLVVRLPCLNSRQPEELGTPE